MSTLSKDHVSLGDGFAFFRWHWLRFPPESQGCDGDEDWGCRLDWEHGIRD